MQPASLTQSKLKAQPHPQFVYMQPYSLTQSKLEAKPHPQFVSLHRWLAIISTQLFLFE